MYLYKANSVFRDGSKNDYVSFHNNVFTISEPWHIIKNKFLRYLCHFCVSSNVNSNRFRIPYFFKKIWFRKLFLKAIPQGTNACFMFNAHFYDLAICSSAFLKKHYNNCKLILFFSDKYDAFCQYYKSFPSIETIRAKFDLIVSYNSLDVKKYGFIESRFIFPSYEQ